MSNSNPTSLSPSSSEIIDNPLQQPVSGKKQSFYFILISFVAISLIISTGLWYLFLHIPQAQAKQYLEETSKYFNIIQKKLNDYQGNFDPLSKSFAKSKTAFTEVTGNPSYEEAVEDTKQDIIDIHETLQLINEARKTKESLKVPQDLKLLDQDLNNYYEKIEKSMLLLLEFEDLQTKMLNASGAKLNQEELKINSLVKNGVSRQVLVDYFENLSKLSSKATAEFKTIIPPADENLKKYHEIMLDHHEDVATSTAAIAKEISNSNMESDKAAYEQMVQLSNRTTSRDLLRQQTAKDFASNSPIRILIEKATIIETQITKEFYVLKEKYNVNINDQTTPTITPFPLEASPSAVINANPTNQSTSSAIPQ